MGINCQNTSDAQGFNIFEKLATEEIVCGGQNNFLNIYILFLISSMLSKFET